MRIRQHQPRIVARGAVDLVAAARNLRTALTFEPGNAYFKKKLDEVSAAQRAAAQRR